MPRISHLLVATAVTVFAVTALAVCLAHAESTPYGDGSSWWRADPYENRSQPAVAGQDAPAKLDAYATAWANGVSGKGFVVGDWLETLTRTVEQSATGVISIAPVSSGNPAHTYKWAASMSVDGNGTAETAAAKGGRSKASTANKLVVKGHLYCYIDRKAESECEASLDSADIAISDSDTWTAAAHSANQGNGRFFVSSHSRAKGQAEVHAFNPLEPAAEGFNAYFEWFGELFDVEDEDVITPEMIAQALMGSTTAKTGSYLKAQIAVQTVTVYANGQSFHTIFGIDAGRVSGTGSTPVTNDYPVKDAKPGEVGDPLPLPPLPPESFGNPGPKDAPTDEDVWHGGTDDTPKDKQEQPK